MRTQHSISSTPSQVDLPCTESLDSGYICHTASHIILKRTLPCPCHLPSAYSNCRLSLASLAVLSLLICVLSKSFLPACSEHNTWLACSYGLPGGSEGASRQIPPAERRQQVNVLCLLHISFSSGRLSDHILKCPIRPSCLLVLRSIQITAQQTKI